MFVYFLQCGTTGGTGDLQFKAQWATTHLLLMLAHIADKRFYYIYAHLLRIPKLNSQPYRQISLFYIYYLFID